LKKWGKMYSEEALAEIAIRAQRVMSEIRKEHPDITNIL